MLKYMIYTVVHKICQQLNKLNNQYFLYFDNKLSINNAQYCAT